MPRSWVEIFQVITLTGRPANEPGERQDLIAGNTLLMRIASNLYMTMAAPVRPFSCNTGIKVTSAELGSPAYVIRPLLWVRLFGRIQKRICDLRSYEFFSTETTEDPKKDHLRLLYTSVAYRFFFSKNRLSKMLFSNPFPKKTLRSWISEIRIWIWSEESTLSVDSSDQIQGTPAGLAQECLLSGYPSSERLKHARVCLRKCFDRRP